MSVKEFQTPFKHKIIYIFSINDEAHKGLVKIGDATLDTQTPIDSLPPNCSELNKAAHKRIKEYTNTAGITYNLLHTEVAVKTVKKDNSIELLAFRDHDVHKVLENSNIKKKKIGDTTGSEWYEVDLETAKKAILAVKGCRENLGGVSNGNISPIVLRPEQSECIKKVVHHFKKADKFLINAKMRYGKTFVALGIVKECQFKKTIIITHRPVVNAGWYEDFTKIFNGENYLYGSKTNGNGIKSLLAQDKGFIYFASIQDLRESKRVGGQYDKNEEIFDTVWDCVIVDEAHEGTQTALGEDTIAKIVKEEKQETKFLALSGTPFNIVSEYDDDSIYTWDYIMEQESKYEWDKKHFGDSNPYEELPEMRIYTYDLGDLLNSYTSYDDKAFNFSEFFRTWTGDYELDYADMPPNAQVGDFVHEKDVLSFLNLMTKKDENSNYPFSREEYRQLFHHTLWMIPGVREAKALKNLMSKHPVFGLFNIVNVAGSDDEESKDALNSVRKAIKDAEDDGFTITLSCGKLTTGVTVREWTGVFMLSGSYSTSAANYLQTIFRVQSPCNKNGKIKELAYVFDFAPDRTLKMVADAVSVSTKAGKSKLNDKNIMGKFLNYCSVISISGSEMKEYSASRLLQQLKRAYADKVVSKGFADSKLYNDELFNIDDVEFKKFDELKNIIAKGSSKKKDIVINDQGLSKEEREEKERLQKKKTNQGLTEEEKERLKKIKKDNERRKKAINTLRAISIRMPLLIFGANVSYDEDVTLQKFVELVDDESWTEFMPKGVTKKVFEDFRKYYDEEVFLAAGHKIRNIAKDADSLEPTERVAKIAELFNYFKNPDSENVLTPWRVVNMHLSNCIGGYVFYNNDFSELLKEPTYVIKDEITQNVFGSTDTELLEINSKSGLYPLFLTYTMYRKYMNNTDKKQLTIEEKKELWNKAVTNNIFVICATPMAKAITKRSLTGYTNTSINAHYVENLVDKMKDKSQNVAFEKKILNRNYWKKGNGKMKFNAIVGNPPYQKSDGGSKSSSVPLYHHFVNEARKLNSQYVSMIIPAKWYSGGRGLDKFRASMLKDTHIQELYDYRDSEDLFTGVDIAGGVCYFLWNKGYNGECNFESYLNNEQLSSSKRKLSKYPVFIRDEISLDIIEKVLAKEKVFFDSVVSSQKPFGLRTYITPDKTGDIKLRYNKGIGPFKRKNVLSATEWIDKWKVIMSYLTNDHAGRADKEGKRKIFSSLEVLPPKTVCTETYLVIATFDSQEEAENCFEFLKTKFVRFLVAQITITQHLSKANFMMVPYLDFKEKWEENKLYKQYEITEEEIKFIDSTIKPM